MRTRLLIIVLALLVGPLAPAAAGGDWPQFQGPNRNGTSDEAGLARSWSETGPPVRWTVGLGPGYGGAAVRGGEVYLLDREPSEKDLLRCLDLESGQEKWRREYAAEGRLSYRGSRGVPTVTDRRVFTIGPLGHVQAVDRESREVLWSVRIPDRYRGEMPRWGWAQSPLVHDGLVIIAPLGEEVGVAALDAETGRERWRSGPLGDSHSTPTLLELNGTPQVLFLTTRGREEGLLSSFDPATGRVLWQSDAYANRIPIPAPIKVDETRIFLTGGYRGGSLMLEVRRADDSFTTSERFRLGRGSQIHLPLLHDGHLYLLANENWNDRRRHEEGGLACVSLTGEERWRTGDEPFFGRGNMIRAGDMLILQDGYSGVLRLVRPDPSRFHLLAEANVFGISDGKDHQMWAPMALSDGRLLMRSQSELKCIDLREARATPGAASE